MRESFIKASEEFTKSLTGFEDILDNHNEVQEEYFTKRKSYYDKVNEYKSKQSELELENVNIRGNIATLKVQCEKLENQMNFTGVKEIDNQIEELNNTISTNTRNIGIVQNILSNGNQELITLANEYYQITYKYLHVAEISCNEHVSALDNIIKIAESEKERLRYEFLEPLKRNKEEAWKETNNKPSYVEGGK